MYLKKSCATLLALTLSLIGSARADITTGLVLKLNLDETTGTTAADSSGQGNNATLVNFPANDLHWTGGWAGGGIKINNPLVPGTTNYLSVPDAANLNFNTTLQYSVATWVKMPTAQIAGAGLIAKGYGGGGEQYDLDINASKFRMVTRPSAGGTAVTLSSAANISSNWTHVAVVWDGAAKTMRMYVNGQVSAAVTNNGLATSFATTNALTIGARTASNNGRYGLAVTNSFVDDVRIYNRILSAGDVFELYASNGRVPVMATQPRNVSCYVGDMPVFNVGVDASNSTMPVTYQWMQDGTNVLGATNASLILTNVQMSNVGTYSVLVSNIIGVTTSAGAALQVQALPAVDIATGLVGQWKFNEASGSSTAADSSTNATTGTLNGFTDLSQCWMTGIIDGALGFNADTSTVNVVTIPALATPAPAFLDFSTSPVFTLGVWIKGSPTQLNGAAIIAKGNGGGGEQFSLDIFNGVYRFYVRNAAGTVFTVTTTTGPNNVWQHLTATCNAANGVMSVYVNGILTGTTVAPFSLLANTHEVSIGNRQSAAAAYNFPFTGSLDDVRIYNRQLTSVDIGALYLSGGVYPPLFTVQPENITRYIGDEIRLSTVASGTAPIFYQWKKNNTNVLGATNASLLLTNLQATDAGTYTLLATNAYGSDLTTGAVLTVSAFVATDLLAGHWKFDDASGGTAVDSSANANSGFLVAFPGDGSQWVQGRLGGGLNFNVAGVTTTYVSVPDSTALNFNDGLQFSISAWVRGALTQATGAAIVSKGTGGGGEEYTLDVSGNLFRFYVRNSAGVVSQIISPTGPSGSWQHVVGTFDAGVGTMKIYVNGQLTISGTASTSLLPNNHEVTIGNRQSAAVAYNLPFVGMIDDVRIYSRALNAANVQQLFTAAGSLSPIIYSFQPQDGNRFVGDSIVLSATADGDAPLGYQWKKNSTNIIGATNLTYSLGNLQTGDSGTYTLFVSNLSGNATSNIVISVQPVPAPDTNTSLIAHWTFDETTGVSAADSSGNGNNVSLFNFAGDDTQWEAGRIGGALHINNMGVTNQFAGTDNPLALQNGNLFSFSFWAKADAAPHGVNPRIITPIGTQHWVLWSPNRGVGFFTPTNSTEPSTSSWNHFVVTFNRPAGTYSLYVNGKREVTDAGTYARTDPLDPTFNGYWIIGHSEVTTAHADFWNGLLDDMYVYNRILNINDVRSLYFTGGQPSLSITSNGGSMVLAWSVAATGYRLQSTDNLTTPSWSDVSGTPVASTDGMSQSITVTASGTTKFYRLTK